MNLSEKFAALKIKTPLHKAFPRRVPPIEFTDTETDNNDLNGHVKAKKPLKQPRKILQIKKSKFQDNAVYYSSGMEDSDGEQDDSDSEMETEPDYEWIAFVRQRAALGAAGGGANVTTV